MKSLIAGHNPTPPLIHNQDSTSMAAPKENENDRGWHVDKRVNLGHFIATAGLTVSLIGWGLVMDRRVTVLEERITYLSEQNARRDQEARIESARLREEFAALRFEIRETNKKLDRLIERQPVNGAR